MDCACCDMSESELVQQALLHKRKLSVERKNRKREAEAKRKRAIAKARATKGATPSDIKRVAAARGFVVTDDEVRRMFAVFPAARPKASVDALRTFFAAETAEARRTGAHSYKPPADPDLKWILLALDAAAAGSKDLELAAGSSFTSGPRIKLARGANATTTAPCLMSGRGDRLRPAQTALDSDAVGTELNKVC